ncbi:hypothetical protein KAR91_31450 [Candidatus Pacearchaeota archaeon]|nr:hypothetical protein [Candidatus Pacearchaeota archaeon]
MFFRIRHGEGRTVTSTIINKDKIKAMGEVESYVEGHGFYIAVFAKLVVANDLFIFKSEKEATRVHQKITSLLEVIDI